MQNRFNRIWAILISILLLIGVYYSPPVHDRLAWRLESARTQIKYMINPPDEAVFQPTQQAMMESIVHSTMTAMQAESSPAATSTHEPGPAAILTITPTPLPATVILEGIKYEDQHGRQNSCTPANFSMALTYWGWDGNRDVIIKAVKPNDKDKNVMPYEIQDYITEHVPGITSVMRYGGDIDMLKRMVSAGFPVVVEKGIYEVDLNGKYGWMGHDAFVTGYDDANQLIIYQDTYQPDPVKNPGHNRKIGYAEFNDGWRAFNYVFVVVYPVEKQNYVMTLLGALADDGQASHHALDVATAETQTLTGADRFFAWFNVGTSHIALFQYADAAIAYDYAFSVYADLDADDTVRPYRMLWYQTGPYKAYYYTNRFADVINLANTTLNDTIAEPVLEESLYWRGQAYYMAGQTDLAVKDYRAALKVHPHWGSRDTGVTGLGNSAITNNKRRTDGPSALREMTVM